MLRCVVEEVRKQLSNIFDMLLRLDMCLQSDRLLGSRLGFLMRGVTVMGTKVAFEGIHGWDEQFLRGIWEIGNGRAIGVRVRVM